MDQVPFWCWIELLNSVLKVRCDYINIMLAKYSPNHNQLSTINFRNWLQHLCNLNFMAPFRGWASTVSRLQGGSLLFTTIWQGFSAVHAVFETVVNQVFASHISSILDLIFSWNWFDSASLKLQHVGISSMMRWWERFW